MCPFDCRDPVALAFDIFALGCVFGFTVLNGTHPFGTNPITAISNWQPMTLTLDQMEISVRNEDLFDLIGRMLHYETRERPSAYEVLVLTFHREQQQIEQEQETTSDLVIYRRPSFTTSTTIDSSLQDTSELVSDLNFGDR